MPEEVAVSVARASPGQIWKTSLVSRFTVQAKAQRIRSGIDDQSGEAMCCA